jgi:hypothetical protein
MNLSRFHLLLSSFAARDGKSRQRKLLFYPLSLLRPLDKGMCCHENMFLVKASNKYLMRYSLLRHLFHAACCFKVQRDALAVLRIRFDDFT